MDVQRLGSELHSTGTAYNCYLPVLGAAQEVIQKVERDGRNRECYLNAYC